MRKLHTHPPTQWRSNINLDWLVLIGATLRTLHICADFLRRMKPSAAWKKETHSNNETRDVKMSVYRNLSFFNHLLHLSFASTQWDPWPGPARPGLTQIDPLSGWLSNNVQNWSPAVRRQWWMRKHNGKKDSGPNTWNDVRKQDDPTETTDDSFSLTADNRTKPTKPPETPISWTLTSRSPYGWNRVDLVLWKTRFNSNTKNLQ